MVEATRRVLPTIKASSSAPYRLLMEAVGLPVPAGASTSPYAQRGWQGQQQQQQDRSPYGYGYHYNGNNSPHGATPQHMAYGPMGQNLSPLLIPQNMPLSQAIRAGSPNLGMNGSPRTPIARQRGRLSPASQMMSPGSDPFNPVSTPCG